MSPEELQELVTAATRREIIKQINPQQSVNESLTVAAIAAVGLTGAFLVAIRKYTSSKALAEFIKSNIPDYEKDTNYIFRKFKYVATMSDVDAIEKEVEQYLKKLDDLYPEIEKMTADVKDGQQIRNAAKKVNTSLIRKDLRSYVDSLKSAFTQEIKELRRQADNKQ